MQFELDEMHASARYELLLGSVVPRPVAIVTTLSAAGQLNAAPYGLFNVMCVDPPIVMVAALPHPHGRLKDTARNILETKEFVLNLVSRGMAEAMNTTCIDAPPGIDEAELAGLSTTPSASIQPPRLAASPVAFECRFQTSLSFAPDQAVIVGSIVSAYVADHVMLDAERGLIDTPVLDLIGGMHAARWYATTRDRFEMERPTWAQRVLPDRTSEDPRST